MSTKWNFLLPLSQFLSLGFLLFSFTSNLQVQAQELSYVKLTYPKVYTKIEQKPQTLPPVPKLPKQLPKPIQNNFESLIIEKCKIYGCDARQVLKVAQCESKFDRLAYNRSSGASGLMQFLPSTFRSYSIKYKIVNPNIWNAYHQIDVATRMFATGQAWQWKECL